MTLHTLVRIGAAGVVTLSLHAMAQTAPDAVTDADIALVQQTMESGCVARGLERKDPEDEVRSFCSCMTAMLKDKLARTEWQRGIAAGANGHVEEMQDMVKPYLGDLQACKARQG